MHLHIKAGPPFPAEAEAFLEARLAAERQTVQQPGESSEDWMRQVTETQAKSIALVLFQQARTDFAEVCAIFGDVNNSAPQWIEANARERALRTALYLVLSVYRRQPDFDGDWTLYLHQIP